MIRGFPRPGACRYLSLLVALHVLAGCTVFRPSAAPEPVLPPPARSEVPLDALPVPLAPPPPAPPQAAAPPPPKPRPKPRPTHKRPTPSKAAAAPDAPASSSAAAPAGALSIMTMRHDQLHGLLESPVQRDGKVIGRAIDMAIDVKGNPREMIVNLSGFLGVGDRRVAFPWRIFKIEPSQKVAITLEGAASGVALTSDRETGDAALAPLIDSSVERRNGEKIGRVVDVLVNAEARPQGIVVDTSQSLGDSKRNFAANWTALSFRHREGVHTVLLDLNRAQIEAVPPYAATAAIRLVSPPAPAAASAAATPVAKAVATSAASAPAPAARASDAAARPKAAAQAARPASPASAARRTSR
ncbi:PRC-barrel domain-containing protein [Chitinasiproducens palmae]|uniref:PRC-barrel domain-containing protein n=1 Tax=Chitinasiproducens palmae TaxID=1770053 RepID=A0A1H2PMI8_9BURK|nr:PRC-barrel domain-containing protein [Chitinasiproducens palmae]SDV47787.1 PRC-barrel domain-containing protein [Chitinasiproducens palmae]